MDEKRKARPWAWRFFTALALPVAYVLSYGPYQVLYGSSFISAPVRAWLEWFYSPLAWVLLDGPKVPGDVLMWYLNFWIEPGNPCGPQSTWGVASMEQNRKPKAWLMWIVVGMLVAYRFRSHDGDVPRRIVTHVCVLPSERDVYPD